MGCPDPCGDGDQFDAELADFEAADCVDGSCMTSGQ
jgi:hypothetical protein